MSGMYKSFIYLLYEHRRVQPGLFLMRVQPAVRTSAAVSLISSGTPAVGALALVNAVSGGLWAGVGSAWTGRVGVCVCLPNFWVQAGRVLPAVNHHFRDHACAYDPRANQQALQQPP